MYYFASSRVCRYVSLVLLELFLSFSFCCIYRDNHDDRYGYKRRRPRWKINFDGSCCVEDPNEWRRWSRRADILDGRPRVQQWMKGLPIDQWTDLRRRLIVISLSFPFGLSLFLLLVLIDCLSLPYFLSDAVVTPESWHEYNRYLFHCVHTYVCNVLTIYTSTHLRRGSADSNT